MRYQNINLSWNSYISQKNIVRGKGKHGRNGNYQKTRIQLAFVNMLLTNLWVYAGELKNTSHLLDMKNKRGKYPSCN